VHTQQWTYGAGWNEDAGRVIKPRKGYSRGQQDNSQGHTERNADGVQWPEGSSPGCGRASVEDTTGVGCSGRQGLNLAGESPAISMARFGYGAMPQCVAGNHTFFAWCTRPGCPRACYRAVAVGATWRPSKSGSLNMSEGLQPRKRWPSETLLSWWMCLRVAPV
jgi:hypothetical protein